MAVVPYLNPARFAAAGGDYESLVVTDQGATHYWALQAGLISGSPEPNLGSSSLTLSMQGGNSTTGTGPGASDLTGSVALLTADTEGLYANSGYDPDASWSLSMWAKLTGTGAGYWCGWRMSVPTGTNYFLIIHRDDEGPAMVVQMNTGAGGYCRVSSGSDLRGAGWKHIAVTRSYSATASADTIKIYIDGVLKSTGTRDVVGWTSNFTFDDWMIGAQSDLHNFGWQGEITACAFWDGTVLDATQIDAQYDQGLL